MRKRELDDAQIAHMKEVEKDLLENPKYGKLLLCDPFDLTDFSRERLESYLATIPGKPDIIVIDHIQLFQHYPVPSSAKMDHSTAIDYYIRQIHRLCQRFDMACLLLSQMNRTGYKEASKNNGRYDLLSLAEAHELERSSFAVISVYSDEMLKESGEVKICLLKNRGGEMISEPVLTQVDPRYCVIGDFVGGNFDDGNSDNFQSLLNPFAER